MTVAEFVTKYSIGIAAHAVPANPNMQGDMKMNHWHVQLTHAAATLQTYFSLGLAHVERRSGDFRNDWKRVCQTVPTRETVYERGNRLHNTRPAKPDAAEVLECLRLDASDEFLSFEDWASNFGYDADSRAAERTYEVCKRQRADLVRWLGPALFAELLACEEE